MPKLWKLAHQRASKEAREALKLTVDKIVIGTIVVCVWLFFVWKFEGGDEGWKATRAKLLAASAILLIFPFWYAVKFIASLSKIYDEATNKLDEATNQIKELSDRLDRQPHLRLSYAADKTVRRGNGLDQTFLYAENEGGGDIVGVQVKIDEAMFKSKELNAWEGTSIVARPNMSWGSLPDGHADKYSATSLPHGKEIIDFISGPRRYNSEPQLGFAIRIDPRQREHVNPFFWKSGTYKFVMQVSAPDVDKPGRLTLFVDWDGQRVTIRSDEDATQSLDII